MEITVSICLWEAVGAGLLTTNSGQTKKRKNSNRLRCNMELIEGVEDITVEQSSLYGADQMVTRGVEVNTGMNECTSVWIHREREELRCDIIQTNPSNCSRP